MLDNIYISNINFVLYETIDADSRSKNSRYGPNTNSYELVYKLSGNSTTVFNGKTIHNTPGTIELLPKCDNIDYFVTRHEYGECIDVFFSTSCPMPKEALFIDVSSNSKLQALFLKIYHVWITKQEGYQYKSMSIFYEILTEIQKYRINYLPKDKYNKIEKGIEYLQSHCFDKDIDYYAPSHICGISYTYFKNLFMRKFGIAPVQYVTKLRLEYSVDLLAANRYSISEIADMCGYDSLYYFSKKFKARFGVSPKNYKSYHMT